MKNNSHPYAINGSHADSYYAASANKTSVRPILKDNIQADICIVGAGYSGLSTAINLLEKGHKVTLVEGARIGWGASGRNGGQIVHGLNASLETISYRYGQEKADYIGGMVREGAQVIREFVRKYDIQCDLKKKNIFAAYTVKQMRQLEAKQELWRKHGMDDHEMLDARTIKSHVNSDVYCGGMLDHSGGHLHPLNLALGEADAIESLGGTIYELSPVIKIDRTSKTPKITTQNGTITCKTLVLCGNAYLGHVEPSLINRVMPVSTQIMATESLGELAQQLLPTDSCIEDVRYILDYYRLSADKRLLFGGGSVYGGTDPKNIESKLRKELKKVFPQLKNIKIDYAWSGNFALSFSRVPQMGRLDGNTYFAHGYSGHGVTGSHLFGRILSEAIDGDLGRFDVFSDIKWHPFPGGRIFRVPYSIIGSWYYEIRDKLGV